MTYYLTMTTMVSLFFNFLKFFLCVDSIHLAARSVYKCKRFIHLAHTACAKKINDLDAFFMEPKEPAKTFTVSENVKYLKTGLRYLSKVYEEEIEYFAKYCIENTEDFLGEFVKLNTFLIIIVEKSVM
jgi:hypothetical protein